MKIAAHIKKMFFGVNAGEALFVKRGFYTGSPATIERLETVGGFFLKGYHIALKSSGNKEVTVQLEQVDQQFRGFSYEGAAMAVTILDGMSLFTKNRLKELIDCTQGNKHIYMLHVGAGWAYARLPFGNIERKIKQFDPLLRWLIIDGYGFHQAYFKTKKYAGEMQLPQNLKDVYSKHVFYQGVGRCLWFIDCATPARIAERISRFPEMYQPDLWAGTGLACAYACGADEKQIQQLKELSEGYFPHLAQGAVFAAKARQRAGIITEENEKACKMICSLSVTEAAAIADNCLAGVPEDLSSAEQYEWWRQSIRKNFIKIKEYEPIAEKMAD